MNRLAEETSPYLLQHADNPVEWHPWGDEALALARDQDKPILLSIGYSACHWCHVMAHESFEDDRDRRAHEPAVRQRQGRPRGAARSRQDLPECTPPDPAPPGRLAADDVSERRTPGDPSSAARISRTRRCHGHTGSFRRAAAESRGLLPRPSRRRSSEHGQAIVAALVAHRRDRIRADREPAHAMRRSTAARDCAGRLVRPRTAAASAARRSSRTRRTSSACCGTGAATADSAEPDKDALYMCALTLTRMAEGGIYDQLGGGFCRYSVDGEWEIPHFEKMLYDNGPLLALYAQLWQVSADDHVPSGRDRDGRLGTARDARARRRLLCRARRRFRGRGGPLLYMDAGGGPRAAE